MEVATEMSSSIYESKTAKKVYLYRNGVVNSEPKCLIVNQRQVRDFGSFLNRVTSGLKAPVAIRNIYTPAAGHKVKSLDSLESGRYYVAGGSEHFKKIKYGGSSPQKLLARRPPRKELSIPSRLQQAVVAEARYKKPVEKPFIIHVFRNGDFRYRGARVLLPRRIMGSWEHVLEIVTEKADLFTPAKRLCTLDGHVVHAVSELQDGGKYVAIEGTKPFQRVAYCATDDNRSLMHTFPKAVFRLQRGPRRRPLHHAHKDVPGDSVVSDPGKTPVPPLSQTLRQRQLDRRKTRPMAGRKNKEAREKAIEDHRADSIFGGSPTRDLDTSVEGPLTKKNEVSPTPHPLSTSVTKDTEADTMPAERKPGVFHAVDNSKQKEQQQTAEYSEDTQGDTVFKAKAQRDELEDAEVVVESHDTEVEQPIDLEEAEEVEEERAELAEEGGTTVSNEVSQTQEEPQAQPLHTSIDLSVNRAQPSTSATTEDETDSKTSPAEQITPSPKPQSGSPKLVRGSATSVRSRHSDGAVSKPENTQQSQEENRKVSEGERSTLESTGGRDEAVAEDINNDINGGDGDDVEHSGSPPVEEEIEEDIPETQEQHQPTTNEAEGAVEPKDNNDPVEEVPEEEVQDEHVSPLPAEPEPLEEEQPTEMEEGEPTIAGNGEPEVTGSTTEAVDIGTSVQEEIAEEVDTTAQDDDTGSSQKEDEPTTTFVVEDIQQQS